MKTITRPYLLVGLAMLAAAGLALALTPRLRVADQGSKINLEAMIPKQFGEWKLDETIASLMVSPDVKAKLGRIYDQTLARNYINGKGELIMLSIAYGNDQSYSRQVHRPEVCYPTQGFQVKTMSKGSIDFNGTKLPVMKLVATQGPRIEPITYWVMMGNSPVRGNWEQHFARLKYGLTGKTPYGMVIRVSTISANEALSYRIEEQFVRDMLGAVPLEYRKVLTGAELMTRNNRVLPAVASCHACPDEVGAFAEIEDIDHVGFDSKPRLAEGTAQRVSRYRGHIGQ